MTALPLRFVLSGFVLLLLGGVLPAQALRTFHVSPKGMDNGNGSEARPWKTLQHAANQAKAGDLIVVKPGNYAGFSIPTSGTAVNRITFRAEPGAVIDTPANVGGSIFGIGGSGRDYITVEGFTFTPLAGQPQWNSAIKFNAGPGGGVWRHGNVYRNNVVQTSNFKAVYHCIYASWQDGIVIEGNTVNGGYNSGIYVANSSRNYVVRGNTVTNVGGNGIHNNGDLSAGNPGINTNALIENNIVYNVGFDTGGQAIGCDGVQDSRIQNNLLYDIRAKGISLYATNAGDYSKGNVVVNNTVVMAPGGYTPMRLNDSCTGNQVLNNVFIAASATAAWVDAEESGLSNGGSITFFDYNVTYGVVMVGGVKRNDWKTTYGYDAHSISSTPTAIFVDAEGKNHRLKEGSPAIDVGTSKNAPARDLLGKPRPDGAKVDIGAYESSFTAAKTAVPTPIPPNPPTRPEEKEPARKPDSTEPAQKPETADVPARTRSSSAVPPEGGNAPLVVLLVVGIVLIVGGIGATLFIRNRSSLRR